MNLDLAERAGMIDGRRLGISLDATEIPGMMFDRHTNPRGKEFKTKTEWQAYSEALKTAFRTCRWLP